MEDVWLVLTASDPNPEQALAYARKALEINPGSSRARRGWEWALARVEEQKPGNLLVKQSTTASLSLHRPDVVVATFPQPTQDRRRNLLYPVLLAAAMVLLVSLLGLFVLARPALASLADTITAPTPRQEILWAPVDIAKPAVTPLDVSVFGSEAGSPDTISGSPDVPALAEPEAGEVPGIMAMEIVEDASQREAYPPSSEQAQYPTQGNGDRWIDVNLSEQRVYVYEGDVVVNSFVVSTGVAQTPTVTGKYKIYVKVPMQDMSGPGYYLQDVPWVMFFYDEYGFHGTYWHNNFGTPMSRGCVNLSVDDAAWLYNWASVGTVVDVHY
jgi:lipoprotein-anchoring transpeptidase ErfK/SrfK